MKEIDIDHLLDLVAKLTINTEYDYVNESSNKILFKGVNYKDKSIECSKVNTSNNTERSANITQDNIKAFVEKVRENSRLHIESVWNGSGNNRSAWEGLFAHTSEFYVSRQDNKKYLVWVPSHPHTVGVMKKFEDLENSDSLIEAGKNNSKSRCLQIIYYGAPGVGKSHKIAEQLAKVDDKHKFRTTFHPDSDYASFVGAYKPVMDGDQIKYKFVEQIFLKAYKKAWEDLNQNVYLIIEEINRGNCAQIFGDIFQLLDRKNGFSEFPIIPNEDIQEDIKNDWNFKISGDNNREDNLDDELTTICGQSKGSYTDKIENGDLMILPPNLFIWATMNTSDQSLFPIDSAFKRRWSMEYIPIEEGTDKDGKAMSWTLWGMYSWWGFVQNINKAIFDTTGSDNKQIGYFFVKEEETDNGSISKEVFVNKVVSYLWFDVFKDYVGDENSPFHVGEDDGTFKDLTFNDFFNTGNNLNEEVLSEFLNKLNVISLQDAENPAEESESTEHPTEGQEPQDNATQQ